MWQHKQDQRELKRVEGDIIKNQREVRKELRDYENGEWTVCRRLCCSVLYEAMLCPLALLALCAHIGGTVYIYCTLKLVCHVFA